MPDGGLKFPDATIADFAKWIEKGAADPHDQAPTAEEFAQVNSWETTLHERKQWRSFQPISSPSPPAPTTWSDHPIDRFVFAKLKQAGLAPVASVDEYTLVRRLTFAITGLPPTLDEIEAFVSDTSSHRVARFVDQLLESPHYGERWARYWMDWIGTLGTLNFQL